ncbi:alpha/beta hydrolase fold domain-containing protein [Streptomyces sp. VNUA74]|nr:alpha/beta hydrolase fold domain-containing protein [Streptomyces sp. VNUA74]WML84431.1 alpha/beta hydrolase fold domain-containing protein [Streptomyces sp. VNUA74]
MTDYVLEPEAQEIADATANPPYLYDLGPEGARKVLDDIQAAAIEKAEVGEDTWFTVPAAVGDVRVRLLKPLGASGPLPVILYIHGGGWILGNSNTHDRLIRELCAGTRAAVAFVEYDRSPEARYPSRSSRPTQLPSGSPSMASTTDWTRAGCPSPVDSVGGNMSAAVAIMAKHSRRRSFVQQRVLTRHRRGTGHLQLPNVRRRPLPARRGHGVVLERLHSLRRPPQRKEITASPLRASIDELRDCRQLHHRRPDDVLRDDGESLRRQADPVRCAHDPASLQRHHSRTS